MTHTSFPISVLELASVSEGGNALSAIQQTVGVAQLAEDLGYKRLWLAEHHNMENIASSATSVLIGHVASQTSHIEIGSGGIMLPNHSPLVIAEQFGTLETLYPGRINLGLGRAPGTDQVTAMALRRNNFNAPYQFPSDVKELMGYFKNTDTQTKVRAFPGEGLDIPVFILGSSTDSAHFAAKMGLPYAFATHFAPTQFQAALEIYRNEFQPSETLSKPYVIACVNVIAAETEEKAGFLSTSLYNLFLGIITNSRKPLAPPGELSPYFQQPEVVQAVQNMISCTFIGGEESIKENLGKFIKENQLDELMVTTYIYDFKDKLESFRILKRALSDI